jgi:hypothetical protein
MPSGRQPPSVFRIALFPSGEKYLDLERGLTGTSFTLIEKTCFF